MKSYVFNKRSEVIEFLEGYDFKYYIPRLEEVMDAVSTKNKEYYIEITDNNKVYFCSICYKENNVIFNQQPFYDCNRAYNFPTKKVGEDNYKEWLEMRNILY